jgi:hypothetical protein
LDEVILGRQQIIFEIEKLKEQVFEIYKFTDSNIINQIVNIINEIKIYMQNSNEVVPELNSNVKDLQNLIYSFSSIIKKTFGFTNSIKGDEVDISFIKNEISQKISKVDEYLGNLEASGFGSILSIAKSNNPASEIANTLDKIRRRLENENPLNPILFELSVESRRLKALGNVPLDEYNLKVLMEKIKKWID